MLDREAGAQTECLKVLWGPRWVAHAKVGWHCLECFLSRSALVTILVTQPLHPVCSGDLSRQIAHQQVSLAFGAGKACTKAF